MNEESPQSDLAQIGLSKRADEILELLVEEGYFKKGQDGYKLAISLAAINNLEPNDPLDNRVNKYHAQRIDPEGELIEFIHLRRPELSLPPFRLLQGLADAGVKFFYAKVQAGEDPFTT